MREQPFLHTLNRLYPIHILIEFHEVLSYGVYKNEKTHKINNKKQQQRLIK